MSAQSEIYFYSKGLEEAAISFEKGNNFESYHLFGSHRISQNGKEAVRFTVWAPRAKYVNLVGDFNNWDEYDLPLERIGDTGSWTISLYGIEEFSSYKYRIVSIYDEILYKSDPFCYHSELVPDNASKYVDISNQKWTDARFINKRKKDSGKDLPLSIYEVNLSSWKRNSDNSYLSYGDISDQLSDYVKDMGYNFIELMPIMEHSNDGSWGYNCNGYFCPTSRFGEPRDFMEMVDRFHRRNIGVILDFTPAYFSDDVNGLKRFDGTYCFESMDPNEAINPVGSTINFDYKKPEVRSFIGSAVFYWLRFYHIDGIKFHSLGHMLNLNKEAGDFLKDLIKDIKRNFPDHLMLGSGIRDSYELNLASDLGLDFIWDGGFTKNLVSLMEFGESFDDLYSHTEDFDSRKVILPLSHQEVYPGKKAIMSKFSGSYDDKFLKARLLYALFYSYPGKKLTFMGDELATFDEWNGWKELSWSLLDYENHRKFQNYIKQLNSIYLSEEAFFDGNRREDSFRVLIEDEEEKVLAYERRSKKESIFCFFNFSKEDRDVEIKIEQGTYRVLMNTDSERYGGKQKRNASIKSSPLVEGRKSHVLNLSLTAYGAMYLKKK